MFNPDIFEYKYHSISHLQLHLVSVSSVIGINHVQKQVTWPFTVWGWSAPVFCLQRVGKNARKPTRSPQIRLIPGLSSLIITSVSLLTDLAASTQPHASLLKGIMLGFFYSLLSQDYRFFFLIFVYLQAAASTAGLLHWSADSRCV